MAETLITVKETSGIFPVLPLSANAADFTFGAIDAVDGGAFVSDGTELILFRNTTAGAEDVTIESQPDQFRRSGDIAAYALGAGEFAAFHVAGKGWADDEGKIHIATSDVGVTVAVIRPKK